MQSETLTFPGANGGILSARLDLPADGEPIAYALFAHHFPDRDRDAGPYIARALNRQGIAVLRAGAGMTLRMFADRKGWPLGEAVVHLRHDRLHAEDRECCEGKDARVDRIRRVVELHGPLDAEQRARLLEIADRCPVHRTLSAGVRIETSLDGASE